MPAPYHGSCQCGGFTIKIDAEPIWVRQCWCRQCRKIAAGSPTNNGLFPTDAMQLTGEVRWQDYQAASGNTVSQGFCGNCGTPVFGRNSGRSGSWVVRLGFLDDADDLSPLQAIWTAEAPDWAVIDPDLEHFSGQPPMPPKS